MTNPNDPVYLQKPEVWYERPPKDVDLRYGLTKREYFAAMAMQGDIAEGLSSSPIEGRALFWLKCADALIAALNK